MKSAKRFDSIEISLIRQINALGKPSTINLGIGEPNIEPAAELRAMARAAANGDWHYSANAGNLSLRKLISRRHGSTSDPASEVCVTAGTMEALYAIMQGFIDPGDEILVPDPGFLAYPAVATLAGAIPVPYPLLPDTWEIDLEALPKLVTPRTKAIFVNSPSNPTGSILSEETLRSVAALADERDLLVISDEVYSEIFYRDRPASMLGMSPSVIVVDGMSKSHVMTGLRLGWVLADATLMKTIYKSHQYIATCASVFTQQLGEAILTDRSWNAHWLDHVRAEFAHQRAAMLDALANYASIELDPPAAAFYAFPRVASRDTVELCMSLAREQDVLVIPGTAFGSRGEGYVRLSYAANIPDIVEGVRRIGPRLRDA